MFEITENKRKEAGVGPFFKKKNALGVGLGTVDRAVVSDTRMPGFESSLWQLELNIFAVTRLQKRRKKGKRGREWQI